MLIMDPLFEAILFIVCVYTPFHIQEIMIKRRESKEILGIFKPNEKITASEVCRRVREKTKTRDSVSYVYNALNRLARQEGTLGWAQSITWIDGKKVIQKEFFLKG